MPIIHLEDGVTPSKTRMVTMGGIFNDIVNSFSNHVETFTPPKGKQWRVVAMRLKKGGAAGATLGTHSFSVSQGSASMLYGESVYSSDVDWNNSAWSVADYAQKPPSSEAALLAVGNITADAANPLKITYFNATDAQNVRLGEITVHVIETPMI